jgi:uncharacterized protein (DUF1697 family)
MVFTSRKGEPSIHNALQDALTKALGKSADVAVRRTATEMTAIMDGNSFPTAPPAKVGVAFHGKQVTKATLRSLDIPGKEEVAAGAREVYIHFPDGIGRSNTVARLAQMAAEAGQG